MSGTIEKFPSRAARAAVSDPRERCLRCRRPARTCLCRWIEPLETSTRFVLLTHPMEYRKERQGTGRMTHVALPNSEILVGVGFNENERLRELLADPERDCRLLYPGAEAVDLSSTPLQRTGRELTLLLLDATWPCAKKMMKQSTLLHALPRVSFAEGRPSEFHTKHQPHALCLATVEAAERVLRALDAQGLERFGAADGERLLRPFRAMIEMQQRCAADPSLNRYRRSGGYRAPEIRTPSLKHTRRSIVFGD